MLALLQPIKLIMVDSSVTCWLLVDRTLIPLVINRTIKFFFYVKNL